VAPGSSCDVQGLARVGVRCGSLVSPTPSSTFACRQVRPRGCRSPSARSIPEGTVRANLLTFAPLRSRTDRPGRFLGLLSWVPSARPSTRARRCACRPSIDMLAKRPLPRRRPVVASASRVPPPKSRSARVVSHHLGGFLRFASRGLVASRCRSWGPPRFRIWGPGPKTATFLCFPAVQVRTPRRNPLRQPERVTASVAPLPFPARSPPRLAWFRCRFQVRRGGRIGSVGFEALLRRRVW
jgi:hypothetical protein